MVNATISNANRNNQLSRFRYLPLILSFKTIRTTDV